MESEYQQVEKEDGLCDLGVLQTVKAAQAYFKVKLKQSGFKFTLHWDRHSRTKMLDAVALPVILTAIAVTIVVLLLLRKNGSHSNSGIDKIDGKKYPPSLPSLPIVGSLPFLFGGMDVMPEYFMKTAEKLGSVFSFSTGSSLTVILNGKEAITDAMMKHGEVFADRPGLFTEVHYLNKDLRGLAFAHYNDLFKKYHKLSLIIQKELGFGSSKVTEERILLQVADTLEEFRFQRGRPFNPKPLIMEVASKVIISICFGERFLTTGNGCRMIIDRATEFVENMDQSIEMAPLLRFLPKYRKKISTMVRCHDGMMKGLDEGVELNKSPDAEPSFVRSFLKDQGPGYDHQELLHIVRDLCLGGSDTIVATILWGLVELANHSTIQMRVRQELNEVVSGHRYPSLDDKAQLPYTEAMILELMRRRTVSPMGLPHATLKDVTTSGYFVPGGSLVMVNNFGVHMNPKTWNDPENFRPERFLDEENNVVGSERINPFGIGRRSCVAENIARQEIFLLLTSLVQHFEILPPEGQNQIKVKDVCGLVTNPSSFKIRLIPRMENKYPAN